MAGGLRHRAPTKGGKEPVNAPRPPSPGNFTHGLSHERSSASREAVPLRAYGSRGSRRGLPSNPTHAGERRADFPANPPALRSTQRVAHAVAPFRSGRTGRGKGRRIDD